MTVDISIRSATLSLDHLRGTIEVSRGRPHVERDGR